MNTEEELIKRIAREATFALSEHVGEEDIKKIISRARKIVSKYKYNINTREK
jgi:hypothetical protein